MVGTITVMVGTEFRKALMTKHFCLNAFFFNDSLLLILEEMLKQIANSMVSLYECGVLNQNSYHLTVTVGTKYCSTLKAYMQ